LPAEHLWSPAAPPTQEDSKRGRNLPVETSEERKRRRLASEGEQEEWSPAAPPTQEDSKRGRNLPVETSEERKRRRLASEGEQEEEHGRDWRRSDQRGLEGSAVARGWVAGG
jgi:hypothetical protein